MHVVMLNQYVPPDRSPTAKLMGDLAAGLRGDGHRVTLIGSDLDYRIRAEGRGARMRRELNAHWQLFSRGAAAGRCDVILSASSPPGLLLTASVLAALRQTKSVHWALDLYPELALALGRRSVPQPLRTLLFAVTRLGYRSNARTVCLDTDMRSWIRRQYGVDPEVIRPWLLQDLSAVAPASLAYPPKGSFTWLYSGNLGQAHDWETLLAAQRLLEDRQCPVTLAVQGGGASRASAQARARQLKLARVVWRPYVTDHELADTLLAAHAHVVTQRTCTRGLLWPSKLGLLMCLPRPLLFIGPEQGAVAAELLERENVGVFAPEAAEAVAEWVQHWHNRWPPPAAPVLRSGWTFADAWPLWRRLFAELTPA
jgi:colanic acid biosynthesis glycosyl transferase WcaI